MAEPLKNKMINISTTKDKTWVAYEKNIKSAVEWLKEKLRKEGVGLAMNLVDQAFPDIVKHNKKK